jgi:surfactin synthase thioesterase subunit
MSSGRAANPFLSFTSAGVAPEQPRLYCFAYAGASASVYAPWARALAPQVAVVGVELPGHGSRFSEAPLGSIAAMASGMAQVIAEQPDEAPFAFYGHSLGAVVAFETARLLGDSGPMHLFAGAARAPHLPPPVPAISHLPAMEFLDAVQKRYGGLPAALFDEPELLEMVLPVLRADFGAYEKYVYAESAPIACPITAFHGTGDPVVHGALVSAWSLVTTGAFRHEAMDGDHFFLNTCRPVLLRHVREVFDCYDGASTTNAASRIPTIG